MINSTADPSDFEEVDIDHIKKFVTKSNLTWYNDMERPQLWIHHFYKSEKKWAQTIARKLVTYKKGQESGP